MLDQLAPHVPEVERRPPGRFKAWLVAAAALEVLWAVACADDPMQPTPDPSNRSPVVTTAIPAQTILIGETAQIDLSAHFSDPDGDALSFSVETQDPAVATATLSGSTLTLAGLGQGTSEIAVTARDLGGLSATQNFVVAVPNRPPVVADSIPALELVPPDSVLIDLSDRFTDPDGDTLTFSVEVSDEAVASASVSRDSLAVVAVGAGAATLTVTATDPGEASVSLTIVVTVANQSPVLSDSIPRLEMVAGDTVAIALHDHFSDPDGDTLTFSVEVSDEAVASASVSADTLAVSAIRPGTVSLTVAAKDPGGLMASHHVDVTVANRAPILTDSIAALEIFTSDSVTVDLLAHFSDPDGDTLSFSAETSDREVATVSLSGHVAAIMANGSGTAEITVAAGDPGALTASQTFVVTVPNRQPVVTETIPRHPLLSGESITIDLLGHFGDPDGDALEFTALTSDGTVASASTADAEVTVVSVGPGAAEVTVIAQDPGELSTAQSFVVNVPANADRDALIALYEATAGPNWDKQTNWLSNAPLGSWEGVSVNAEGRVTGLELIANGLVGPIPPELGWLTELTTLKLSLNNLKGEIPPEFGQLRALRRLSIAATSLTGRIPPELGGLGALTALSLSDNALTGPIPRELAKLTGLKTLDLTFNDLTGLIPPGLGSIPKLETLRLSHNTLAGPIPPEFGDLRSMENLHLAGNDLTGSIPVELSQLERLARLVISENQLQGTLPPELGRLRRLEELDLGGNNLTGAIPPALGDLESLEDLLLDRNLLTGQVPASFGHLRNLKQLLLHENSLSGPIPHSLLQIDSLEVVLTADNGGLCVPGVTAFTVWTEKHPGSLLCNEADKAVLTALFESTGGSDWDDPRGWLSDLALERWHGIITDSVGKVLELDLRNNGLVGRLPPELGEHLDRLSVLRIGDNALSGPLPSSLAGLDLQEFDYAGTGLCVPSDESLRTWLDGIPVRHGPLDECPPLSDRDVLVRLYETTDGEKWVDQENWLTDAPLGSWFGVSTDAQGRVSYINLRDNGLAGRLPPEIGDLSNLTSLNLAENSLSGSIPSELGKLSKLERLFLGENRLAGSIPPQLGSLASLETLWLASNDLSGELPPELGELRQLRSLWVASNDLSGSIPSALGTLERLIFLNLGWNNLTGRIPAALGNLAALDQLTLVHNGLSGSIPTDLGSLRALRRLSLSDNRLSGPIPAELGQLAELETLSLNNNDLSGPIPPELGQLSDLTILDLGFNELTSSLPPELGALSNLQRLRLSGNNLTGPIPPEIGMLGSAEIVRLDRNDLTGPLPSAVANLSSVELLDLSLNSGLGGPLPRTLTQLERLQDLYLTGTGFCAADHPDLLDWLDGVGVRRIALCDSDVRAYLVQAVQSREFPVPLIAREEALLRVFLTARRVNRESAPPIGATFFVEGREVFRTEVAGWSGTIPTRVDESSLENSANALIPGSVVQPGLEMVIEVDQPGDLDPSLGVDRRIPKTGRIAVEVADVPPMDLTLIPFLWSEDPDSTIVRTVRAMAADPENHELLWGVQTLLPVNELAVTGHEPVWTSDNNIWRLFDQTAAIRVLEGGHGHYMGMLAGEHRGARGLASAPGRVSFSVPDAGTIAHELGHNMSLLHAPCSNGAPLFSFDPGFPQIDGSIGAWGYDFRAARGLVDPFTSDVMSYCDPHWISEYGFSAALDYRLRSEGSEAAALASPSQSLLLWGGADAKGNPFLEPAFVVEAPPRLPSAGTEYRLEGRDPAGAALFSLTFDMPAVADGEGAGAFAFVVPAHPRWENALASIELSGPTGTTTLSAHNEDPMAILLDPRNGKVRGFLRNSSTDPRIQASAAADVVFHRGFEVLFSRGIPDAAEWRR